MGSGSGFGGRCCGGYSGEVNSNLVGPEGGQVLVDRTVERINALWPDAPPR
jgi:hypothetical protein